MHFLLLLGDYKSPGFNRSNIFLRRISNPPGRLTELRSWSVQTIKFSSCNLLAQLPFEPHFLNQFLVLSFFLVLKLSKVKNIFLNNKGKRVYRRLAFFYKFYKRGGVGLLSVRRKQKEQLQFLRQAFRRICNHKWLKDYFRHVAL